MSSDVAIRVDGLGKQYRIGGPKTRYRTFRETLIDAFAAPFRRAGRLLRGEASAADLDRTIWALKDVSFEVQCGEVIGIIGRNGAGKSTLLKILSRITEPTEGSADVYGRVGSLLEVGTGFHPELTGRENIYLNGAILGMHRAEIDRKLDEIVAFAEIEKFADTPVKHYSSGMYVRLAFAVAAHLEPEILLVDEVLAVGDAGFQRKCIGKLDEVAREGRTVLFVSHNMQAVSRLCSRGLLLDDGKIGFDGLPTAAISKYLDDGRAVQSIRKCSEPGEGDDRIRIVEIRLVDELGQTVDTVDIRRPVGVSVRFRVVGASGATLQMSLTNEHRIHVLWTSDHLFRNDEIRKGGEYVETAWIPGNFLAEGRFSVNVGFVTFRPHQMHVWLPDAISFFVKDSYEGDSLRGDYGGELAGVTRPELKWTLVSED